MRLTQYEIEQLKKLALRKGGTIRFAFYCRKSQRDTSENSIDTQIAVLNSFLEDIRNDTKIPIKFDPNNDIYAEDNRSGTDASLREEFMRMISSTTGEKNSGYYTAVLVFKQDRFARNTNDSNFYRGLLLANSCLLLSTDVRDNGDAISELLLNVIAAFNQYYAQNNAFLVVNGMLNLAKKGKCVSSLPYGLKADDERNIYVDKEEAKNVRKIFELAKNNSSMTDIYDYLIDNDIKRSDGTVFGINTIHDMLRNEKYIGTYLWASDKNKMKRKPKRKKVYRNDIPEIRIEDCFEAIIDKDLFNQVQDTLDKCKNSHQKSLNKDGYILYGLVYCGDCGTRMYGATHSGGRSKILKRYYECPCRAKRKNDCQTKMINANYLEKLAMDVVYETVNDLFIKKKKEIIDCAKTKLKDIESKISRYKSELEDHNKNINNLINLQLSNPKLAHLYQDKIFETEESIEKIKGQLTKALSDFNEANRKIETSINEKIIEKERLFEDKQATKSLINEIIKRIEINNDKIKFILNTGNEKDID